MTLRPNPLRALALLTTIALVAPVATQAGVCLVPDSSCNAYFLSIDLGEGGMRDLAGYEYGCGAVRRLATGVFYDDDDNYYFGLTGSNGDVFDTGQVAQWNYVIEKSTLIGDYNAFFTYMSGGVLAGHGSGGTMTATSCSNPNPLGFADLPDLTAAP